MEAVLLQNGYQPILACDGVEALEVLDKKHVDLIVLDIMMPRMDGYEFTRDAAGIRLRPADFDGDGQGKARR